jgi:hypothetical protein
MPKTFLHFIIPKCIWASPDGSKHNHSVHILTDRKQNSNALDVLSITRAACDTVHHTLDTKVRERLSLSKRATQRFL